MNYQKLKKRSIAAVITASVILLVLLLNILVTFLASKNVLYLDLTKTNYTEITKVSDEHLSKLQGSDNDITIYFLADKDELQNAGFGYSTEYTGPTESLWGMKHIYELANVYAEKYDFISVKHLDIDKDMDTLEKYKSSISTVFNKQKIIVDNCITEKDENGKAVLDSDGDPVKHHNFRVSSRDYFYYFDTNSYYAYGFNGELRFTSMIMSVAGESPVAYFSYGHGEDVGSDPASENDYGKAQALRDYIYNSGFSVKKASLTDDSELLLSDPNARILIIFNPKSDMIGSDASSDGDPSTVDEISVIRRFTNRMNCHLMVFSDPSDNVLENLSEFLFDYWGLTFDNSNVKDTGVNSMSPDGKAFLADYETSLLSPGVSLTAGLTALDSQPKIYFENAGTISIDYNYANEVGYSEGYSMKYAGSIFNTPASSEITLKDGTVLSSEKDGTKSLMAITYNQWSGGSDYEQPTYVIACASTSYVSEKALSNEYGNSEVIGYALRVMGRDSFTVSIEMKTIETEKVTTPTEALMSLWKILIYVIPPIASLVLGTVVFVKRRHA